MRRSALHPTLLLTLLLVLSGSAAQAQVGAVAAPGGVVRGDVDGDGLVTRDDARLLSEFLATRKPLPGGRDVHVAGDANGDGRLTVVDVAAIERFAAGRPVERMSVGQRVEEPPQGAIARIDCRVSVADRQLRCENQAPRTGGANAAVTVGGQNVYVKLTSSSVAVIDGGVDRDTMRFDVVLQNLLPQAMGTEDGTSARADGIRVFFHQGPTNTTVPAAGGLIVVANPDGTADFTRPSLPDFRYEQVLQPGQPSAAEEWKLAFDAAVQTFAFSVYVSAPVQFEQGWVEIYPPGANRKNPAAFVVLL